MALRCPQSTIDVATRIGPTLLMIQLLSDTSQMTVRLLQDMARGSLSTVRQGIQRAKSDLSAKEYRNIDAKYRAQLLELKTAEMAASDLNEYHKVQCPQRIPWGRPCHQPLASGQDVYHGYFTMHMRRRRRRLSRY